MSSTSLVTDANLQPMRVLPKPSSTPLKYFQRQLASMGKLEPGEQTAANIQLLWIQLVSIQPMGWLPMPISNPLRVLPQPSSAPLKYFQGQLASLNKVEPCEHNAAKFQLLWNQLAYPQPLRWLPMPIFNLMRVLPKPSFTPSKYFQRKLDYMVKLEPGEQTAAKIQLL